MNVKEAICTRRSTRKYLDKIIEKELLEELIEAGRAAPSGGNSQSAHLFAISDRKLLEEIRVKVEEAFRKMEISEGMYPSLMNSINRSKNGNYRFFYDAPVLVVIANQKDYGNNIADTACILENMMILANEKDLGSCWINQLRWLNEDEALLKIFRDLGLEEDERIYGALALGYPDTEDGKPVRTPLPRKGNKVEWIG